MAKTTLNILIIEIIISFVSITNTILSIFFN